MRRVWKLALSAVLLVAVALAAYVRTPIEDDITSGFAASRRLFDRDGTLLREAVNGDGARARWTPLDELSPLVVDAVLATEDSRFYDHAGVDWRGVARASVDSLKAGKVVSGASTLTMQLSRLLYAYPRTGAGKLQQMLGAWRLENSLSKDEILEQYLNRAPFGAGTVGVEAASRRYFDKPSQHLSLAEAALIGGLLKAPTALNPLRNAGGAQKRQKHVLARMLKTGRIGENEHERAVRQPLTFVDAPPPPVAMHFTDYVLAQRPPAGDVQTTLDLDLQRRVEALVREHVRSLKLGGLTNAAVVVLDNQDCSVLTMAGSTDYWSHESGSVNGALARRQPGSALKPFTYAASFEAGMTPASVLADVETTYPGADGALFTPGNYSGQFSGPVLLSDALGRSLNVPAVRVANVVGPKSLLEQLHDAGFQSLDQPSEHYGIGLTLGNGEVTLVELAQGYAMLARGGMSCTARGYGGARIPEPRRVFSERVSYLITHILSDEELRRRAFGSANPLMLGFPMAVKTGTSTNWRDSWVVGYTKTHTVAVWTGDFEGRPMNQLSGAVGAGPLFHGVARLVAQGDELPVRPSGVDDVVVCPLSGARPGPHCPYRRNVLVEAGTGPEHTCDWHRPLKLDRRNGLLASSRCPRRYVSERVFEVLPARFAQWEADEGREPPPQRYSPRCPDQGAIADALVITSPRTDDVYLIEPGYARRTQSLRLEAEVDPPVADATWIVTTEGRSRTLQASWPYTATWHLEPGRHRVELVAGERRSEPVVFDVR